jgi:hypothetical protein
MFYQKGIDITNDKQMFNFLRNHFEYYTANSWNGLRSVANNVKLYNLNLSGDWAVAYDLLAAGEYDEISWIIHEWEREHRGYEVGFNGRCGGYLVLTDKGSNRTVLPEAITNSVDYEDYKSYCREYYGSVKANRWELVEYTKLVQDFDKLCDQLRDFCDELSHQSFEITEMSKAVDKFNDEYCDDLEYLDFNFLKMNPDGSVDISEIFALKALADAFMRICLASCKEYGYDLEWVDEDNIKIVKYK